MVRGRLHAAGRNVRPGSICPQPLMSLESGVLLSATESPVINEKDHLRYSSTSLFCLKQTLLSIFHSWYIFNLMECLQKVLPALLCHQSLETAYSNSLSWQRSSTSRSPKCHFPRPVYYLCEICAQDVSPTQTVQSDMSLGCPGDSWSIGGRTGRQGQRMQW